MAKQGPLKVYFQKNSDMVAKNVELKFFKTSETNQELIVTKRNFSQQQKNTWILVRELCGTIIYSGCLFTPFYYGGGKYT